MTEAPRQRTTIDVFLFILWVLAFIGLVMDILLGPYWLQVASTLFLFIGLGASIQWRRYRSRRWRTLAWIAFVLAFAMLLFRFGSWQGWTGE